MCGKKYTFFSMFIQENIYEILICNDNIAKEFISILFWEKE